MADSGVSWRSALGRGFSIGKRAAAEEPPAREPAAARLKSRFFKTAFMEAADCLCEAIAGRIARGEEIPLPSQAKRGQHLVGVPLQMAPRLALYLAVRKAGMANTEPARRLGVSETVVRQMLNPKHETKAERIQAALLALGKRIVVGFEDAA